MFSVTFLQSEHYSSLVYVSSTLGPMMAALPPSLGGDAPDSRKVGEGERFTDVKPIRVLSVTPPPLPIAILVEERRVEYATLLRNPPPSARSCSGMSGAQSGDMVILQKLLHAVSLLLPLRGPLHRGWSRW